MLEAKEVGGTVYLGKAAPASGSSSGGGSYTPLTDKPQINGVTLQGNKTSADLGLASESDFENKVSVLKTSVALSTTIDTQTTVANDELSAMTNLEGRPNHLVAGAMVFSTSNNAVGIVDSVDSETETTLVTTVAVCKSSPTLTWYTENTGTTLTIVSGASKIYKNGILLQPTEDYTLSGTTLTLATALVATDKITAEVF